MTIKKKKPENKCCDHVEKIGTLVYSWQKCKMVQLLWKRVKRFFQKIKKNRITV